jgi:ABC-type transport system substrate-binding protein
MMFFYLSTSRGVITNGRVAGFNYGGYSNPEYDVKSAAMREELDNAKRTQSIKDLQVVVAGAFYHLPLYRQDALSLYSTARWQGWVTVPDYGFNNGQTFTALKAK